MRFGFKVSGISVSGCMMGASGEIRTLYEELTAEMGKR